MAINGRSADRVEALELARRCQIVPLNEKVDKAERHNSDNKERRGYANDDGNARDAEKRPKVTQKGARQQFIDHVLIFAKAIDNAAERRRIEKGHRHVENPLEHIGVENRRRSHTAKDEKNNRLAHREKRNGHAQSAIYANVKTNAVIRVLLGPIGQPKGRQNLRRLAAGIEKKDPQHRRDAHRAEVHQIDIALNGAALSRFLFDKNSASRCLKKNQ